MKKLALFIALGFCFLTLPLRAQINLLHDFSGGTSDGAGPTGSLLISGTTFYGMTQSDGGGNNGTIFKIDSDGTGFKLLHEFAGGSDDGAWPKGSLIISGSTLYGMTSLGGDNDKGTIFKIETNGTGFVLLHEFAGGDDDGSMPWGLLIISDSTLYGMTHFGGYYGTGTVFKIQTDGNNFTLLHEFSGGADDGNYPVDSLIISGSSLFGMTYFGGDYENGTIFKIQIDGSGFTLLHEFAGSPNDGEEPEGSLILSDSTLYGMTPLGGHNDDGTIFKIETDGSGYSLLHEFADSASDGASPRGSLLLSDMTLYGTTAGSDNHSGGTIFQLQTDCSNFSLLQEFEIWGAYGAYPNSPLLILGSILYGVTSRGGTLDLGVVYSLPLFTITGTVTHEGSPLADVVMEGLPGNPVTNGSGYYSTTVASGWSGTATPSRQYYSFSPSYTNYASIDSDQTTDYTATLSQSLVVTSPAAGSVWQKGKTYAITWLKQGAQNANVKIALFRDANTLVQMIATTTPNDGAYDWTMPATLATGSSYFIRVRTADNLISDVSDKFSIIVPAITVTAPGMGTVWAKGTTKTITWNKVGTQDGDVKIQLFRGASKALDIALFTLNDGSFDWAIPASLANAVYTIRITTLDGKVKGTSKNFTIAKGSIQVKAPEAGALWPRGAVHTITWAGEGALNANVRIQLIRGNQVSTIAATTANDGSFDWIIPANRAVAANYRIRVTTVDNQVTAQSGLFSITSF